MPAGYLQAATESGRNIARGIEQAGAAIGEGLGKAISSYRQGERDKETRKAAYESLAERVINSDFGAEFQAASGDEQAAKLAARSAKFHDMSAAQQKQLIADLALYDTDQKQAKQDAIKAGFDQAKMMQMQQVYDMNEAKIRQRKKLAADQDAMAKAFLGYTPEATKNVTETIRNPEFDKAVQLNEETAGMVQGFRDAIEQGRAASQANQQQQVLPAPAQAREMISGDAAAPAVPQLPAMPIDNELINDTVAKVLDDISDPVGSSSFNRIRPEYREMLGGGLNYRSREANDIPEVLLDRVPTGRTQRGRAMTTTEPNTKRIGAFLQMLNRDGVDTLATRQLNQLINGKQPQLSEMPASAAAAFVQPREAMPAPVTPAQQQDQPATTAPVSTSPSSAIDYSVQLPAETIERDVQVPLTAGDMDTNIREYIQRVMPDASSDAQRQTYEALRKKHIPTTVQPPQTATIEGKEYFYNGSTWQAVPEKEPRKMTDAQAKARTFFTEMNFSEQQIRALESNKYDPSSLTRSFEKMLPSLLQSDKTKRFQAFSEKWIEAALRDRSGAAIAKDEYATARKQFFPVVGDSEETKNAKQQLREMAMKAMYQNMIGAPASTIDYSFMLGDDGKQRFKMEGIGGEGAPTLFYDEVTKKYINSK